MYDTKQFALRCRPSRNSKFHGCLLLGLLLGLALAMPLWAQRAPLPSDEQQAVKDAITRGVDYLKRTQQKSGTWGKSGGSHLIGYAALPGLALLECGVAPSDPLIQKAARYLRSKAVELDTTYELALGVLFLDRLGDPKDRKLIRGFALRLVAGQTVTGGWGYKCPVLNGAEHRDLLTVLRRLEPPPQGGPAGQNDSSAKAKAEPPKPTKPNKPLVIPERLHMLAVVQDPTLHVLQDPADKSSDLIVTTTDNSNTQFALLALWTARRSGIPMNRTSNLIVRRFRTSQNTDGSWGYNYRLSGGVGEGRAMTCAGLIGLGVGHGLAQLDDPDRPVHDPCILNGLVALNKHVGKPLDRLTKVPIQDLYFLWSLERVGVLYNMPTIGDKDWYRWGAQILITNQQADGNWAEGQYPGSSPTLDTCLALLFLNRANLAKDLTAKLPFKAADLNKDIMVKLTPTAPPEPEPVQKPPEPVKTTALPSVELPKEPATDNLVTKPLASPTDTAPQEESSGKKKWIVIALIVLGMLAGGGSLLILLIAKRNKKADEERNRKPKKRTNKRKLQSKS